MRRRRQGLGSPGSSPLLLANLVLLTVVASVVSSLGGPLVPVVAREMGVDLGLAQWSLTATFLSAAVFTPVIARLGANAHRRNVVLATLLTVCMGAALCAFPLGFAAFVAGRALQGVSIALLPLAMAVARERFPATKLPTTISVLSITTVTASGLGFPIAAACVDQFGLYAVYQGGLILCCLATLVSWWVIPASASALRDRVDWPGSLLFVLGASGALVAVSQGAGWGWTSSRLLAVGLVSVVVLVAWACWTSRAPHPLVDLRLAFSGGSLAPNVTGTLGGVAIYMFLSLVMLQVQGPESTGYGLGKSAAIAGAMLLPYSLGNLVGSRLLAAFSRRVPGPMCLPLGGFIILVATTGLALWHERVWQVALAMLVAGVGCGLCFAAMPGLIIASVPARETSSATAFNYVLCFTGFATGSALAPSALVTLADSGLGDRALVLSLLMASALWCATIAMSLVIIRRHDRKPLRRPLPTKDEATRSVPGAPGQRAV